MSCDAAGEGVGDVIPQVIEEKTGREFQLTETFVDVRPRITEKRVDCFRDSFRIRRDDRISLSRQCRGARLCGRIRGD